MERFVAYAKDLRPSEINSKPVIVPVAHLVQLMDSNEYKPFNPVEFKPPKATDKNPAKYSLMVGNNLIRHAVYAVAANKDELLKKVNPREGQNHTGRSARGFYVPKRFSMGWEVQPLSKFKKVTNEIAKESSRKNRGGIHGEEQTDQKGCAVDCELDVKKVADSTQVMDQDKGQERGVPCDEKVELDECGDKEMDVEGCEVMDAEQEKAVDNDQGKTKVMRETKTKRVVFLETDEAGECLPNNKFSLKKKAAVPHSAGKCKVISRLLSQNTHETVEHSADESAKRETVPDLGSMKLEVLEGTNKMLQERNTELQKINENLMVMNKILTETINALVKQVSEKISTTFGPPGQQAKVCLKSKRCSSPPSDDEHHAKKMMCDLSPLSDSYKLPVSSDVVDEEIVAIK